MFEGELTKATEAEWCGQNPGGPAASVLLEYVSIHCTPTMKGNWNIGFNHLFSSFLPIVVSNELFLVYFERRKKKE